ncbi:hypothetical protein BT69DRAFT_1298911 [Atractiella rhizophila]|nr:hypothetical protein BT69DRAFT_1298911 [Atractiella rhizophila]
MDPSSNTNHWRYIEQTESGFKIEIDGLEHVLPEEVILEVAIRLFAVYYTIIRDSTAPVERREQATIYYTLRGQEFKTYAAASSNTVRTDHDANWVAELGRKRTDCERLWT